jgi:hypothetical protein
VLRLIKVAAALNSFASEPEATVPPSEEIFVLSAGQLSDLVAQAIERATAPLESRIEDLERGGGCGEGGEDAPDSHKRQDDILQIVQNLRAENVVLKGELESLQESTARERAADRRRIAALENASQEVTETEQDRLARIEKYLREASDHMMSMAELRGRLGIGKQRLSMLIRMLDPERYTLKKSTTDKRVRYLCLRPVLDSSPRTITKSGI